MSEHVEAGEHKGMTRNGPEAAAAEMWELQVGGLRLKRKVEGFDHVWSGALMHSSTI